MRLSDKNIEDKGWLRASERGSKGGETVLSFTILQDPFYTAMK